MTRKLASRWSSFDAYGQVFTSTTLDYVMRGYFDNEGLLMTLPAEELNEQLLRRNIRLQREDSIHYVSYTKLSHHQISQIFLSTEKKSRVDEIAQTPLKKVAHQQTPPSLKIDKIARRQLETVYTVPYGSGTKTATLHERIRYFDPSQNLGTEIKQLLSKDNLREATGEEIIDENLKRQIMLSLLADHIVDPVLKAAYKEAPKIEPMKTM